MKKLLVLILIVGMASLAGATYELNSADGLNGYLIGDGEFAAYFISIDGDPVDAALLYTGSLAALTDVTGDLGVFLPDAEVILFAEFADAVDPENNKPIGDVLSLLLVGRDDDMALVTLHDSTSLEALSSIKLGIPEPMSLALLVLGGLLVRCRR